MEMKKTNRGFKKMTFEDRYNDECSLQESSLATENAIWFGIEDPKPQIMASDAVKLGHEDLLDESKGPEKFNGWVEWPIPDEVSLSTRMHLTVPLIEELLPYLNYFAITGRLPSKTIEPAEVPVVEPINFADEDTCDAKAARIEERFRRAEMLQGNLHTPGIEGSVPKEKLDEQRAEVRSCLEEVVAAFGFKLTE